MDYDYPASLYIQLHYVLPHLHRVGRQYAIVVVGISIPYLHHLVRPRDNLKLPNLMWLIPILMIHMLVRSTIIITNQIAIAIVHYITHLITIISQIHI